MQCQDTNSIRKYPWFVENDNLHVFENTQASTQLITNQTSGTTTRVRSRRSLFTLERTGRIS